MVCYPLHIKKTQSEHNVLIYCNINILTDLKANVHDVSDIGWADKVHHYSVGAMRTCKYCNCTASNYFIDESKMSLIQKCQAADVNTGIRFH